MTDDRPPTPPRRHDADERRPRSLAPVAGIGAVVGAALVATLLGYLAAFAVAHLY